MCSWRAREEGSEVTCGIMAVEGVCGVVGVHLHEQLPGEQLHCFGVHTTDLRIIGLSFRCTLSLEQWPCDAWHTDLIRQNRELVVPPWLLELVPHPGSVSSSTEQR